MWKVPARTLLSWLAPLTLALLATTIVGFVLTRTIYLQLNMVRLDPMGLRFFPMPPVPPPMPHTRTVVFFGDSSIARWNLPDLPAFRLINRGIGGQTSEQILPRFDVHVTPLAPDVVVLLFGVNDLKTLPLFPDLRARIVERCKANLTEAVRRTKALGASVVIVTLFPTGDPPLWRRPVWSPAVNEAIVEVNAHLARLRGESVRVLDAHAALVDKRGKLDPRYAEDLLHLNPQGYAALTPLLTAALESL